MIVTPKDFDHSGTKRLIWKNKAEILLKDKEFAWYFVQYWVQMNDYRLVRNNDKRIIPFQDISVYMPEQFEEDAADQEPEYVPLIE